VLYYDYIQIYPKSSDISTRPSPASLSSVMRCWSVIGRFASAIPADLEVVGAASGFEDSGLMRAFAFCFPFAFFVGLMQGVGVDGRGGGFSGVQYNQMVTSFRGVPCSTFCSYEPASITGERSLASSHGAISLGVDFVGFVCPRIDLPEAPGCSWRVSSGGEFGTK
jgi:hypothetical protein